MASSTTATRQAMQANYEKLRGEMMQKYDTNGDGQLDDNERQAQIRPACSSTTRTATARSMTKSERPCPNTSGCAAADVAAVGPAGLALEVADLVAVGRADSAVVLTTDRFPNS